jgi:hypothetical protein
LIAEDRYFFSASVHSNPTSEQTLITESTRAFIWTLGSRSLHPCARA